jgi:hypothetical protein
MNDNYRQDRGYAHWTSAKFKRELERSVSRFKTIIHSRLFHYPRSTGPPNTPVELSDQEHEHDSGDGYECICGPDEDYHISMAESRSIHFWLLAVQLVWLLAGEQCYRRDGWCQA